MNYVNELRQMIALYESYYDNNESMITTRLIDFNFKYYGFAALY